MAPTVSYISGAAAASTTVAMSSHQAGDLIVCYAFRTGSTTLPTIPAGWTTISSQTLASPATCAVAAYKIATSSSETTGTWTSAAGVAVNVFRTTGAWNPRPGITWGTGNSATITYPQYGYVAKETVWYLRCAGHTNATNMTTNTPSGWTARGGAATRVRTISTSAASTVAANSVGTNTQSVSATSGWIAATISVISETVSAPPVDVYVSGASDVGKIAAGSGAQSNVGFTGLSNPQGVAVGPDGAVYVADTSNAQVYKMLGGSQSSVGFTGVTGAYMVATAVGSDGAIYVSGNAEVHKMSGGVQSNLGFTGLSGTVQCIAVSADGALYAGNGTQVYKMQGGVQSTVGFTGLGTVLGVSVGQDGAIYALHSSAGGGYAATVSKLLGGSQTNTTVTGQLVVTLAGIGIDADSNLYVSDAYAVYEVTGSTGSNIGWVGAARSVATPPLASAANTTNFFQFF